MTGTRILCPVDFSELGEAALLTGVSLARAQGGAVDLLHVLEPLPAHVAGERYTAFTDRDMRDLQSKLYDTLAGVHDIPIERYLEHGDPVRRIVEFAYEHGTDLIVLGTHGRGGISRWLMGSVAERVVRYAECAVLTVKQPESAPIAAAL